MCQSCVGFISASAAAYRELLLWVDLREVLFSAGQAFILVWGYLVLSIPFLWISGIVSASLPLLVADSGKNFGSPACVCQTAFPSCCCDDLKEFSLFLLLFFFKAPAILVGAQCSMHTTRCHTGGLAGWLSRGFPRQCQLFLRKDLWMCPVLDPDPVQLGGWTGSRAAPCPHSWDKSLSLGLSSFCLILIS